MAVPGFVLLPSETLVILEGSGQRQKIPEECLGLM